MPTFAVQYLEPGTEIANISPQAAFDHLRAAFDRLPISMVLLGWNLPDPLVDACAEACRQADAELYRWHPLLTGDGTFYPYPEWQVVGLYGDLLPGHDNLPEFTFVCPNRPAVREAIHNYLQNVMLDSRFQGIFFDRIRYPSPSAELDRYLGCFCDDCLELAWQNGLNLDAVRQDLAQRLATPEGALACVRALLNPAYLGTNPEAEAMVRLLEFRAEAISWTIADAAQLARDAGWFVGLDCFSPSLTHMVGQDLGALDSTCNWMKSMAYGHTFGPAGLPFELLGLADWLVERRGVPEADAFAALSESTGLPLPRTRADLRARGLVPDALGHETRAGRTAGISTLLAGIELVDVPGVTQLTNAQISADLRALRSAGADGLVLSWDLWRIPLDRLDLVRETWT